MPRELTSHMANGCNENLQVLACDGPGPGGASHHYQIINVANQNRGEDYVVADLEFQNGPIKEVGTNGLTHEALLAILIDRLEGFQSGPYKCEENGDALTYLELAQRRLQSRTLARIARGVEGTHAV